MIKRKQQNVLILLLFCILLAIAVAPIAMLNYSNKKYTNAVNVNKLNTKMTINEATVSRKNDVLKNLNNALKASGEKSNIVIGWVDPSFSDEKISELVHITEEQIKILQTMNALPQITFSEAFKASVSKTSYLDKNDADFAVNIWHLQVEYPEFYIAAYIDTETNVIYDIFIISKKDTFLNNQLSESGFKGYLQNVSGNTVDNFDKIEAYADYTPKYIHLYVINYNENEHNKSYEKVEEAIVHKK